MRLVVASPTLSSTLSSTLSKHVRVGAVQRSTNILIERFFASYGMLNGSCHPVHLRRPECQTRKLYETPCTHSLIILLTSYRPIIFDSVRDVAQVGTERDDAVEHLRDWALRGDEGSWEGVEFGATGGEEPDDLAFQPREPEERRVSVSSLRQN